MSIRGTNILFTPKASCNFVYIVGVEIMYWCEITAAAAIARAYQMIDILFGIWGGDGGAYTKRCYRRD